MESLVSLLADRICHAFNRSIWQPFFKNCCVTRNSLACFAVASLKNRVKFKEIIVRTNLFSTNLETDIFFFNVYTPTPLKEKKYIALNLKEKHNFKPVNFVV